MSEEQRTEEIMKKPTRRIATTCISCIVAGSALFATGGSATAASPQTTGQTSARSTMGDTSHHRSGHRTAHRPVDPWIADQLALFGPATAQRPAPDPWIADQLALFAPAAR
ncbi:hypothetical protein ABZ876_31260 [Streptomyces sp. NPDC046931]|uniref:hypothetical protein n=1 Tax=Streptomyces sp. NPDC046931 TaxID=3154806 RepID=UPI00341065C9